MSDISAVWHVLTEMNWLQEKRLLLALGTFYTFLITSTVLTRNRLNFQAVYFGLLCIGVYAAEYLNKWLAKNWKLVSNKQQYFDSSGLFISVIYSMPILFNLLLLIIVWMRSASKDLIKLKRQEVILQTKAHKKKEN